MPRRTLDLRVIGTMTLVLALACAPPPAERPFPGPFRVIDLDTLRADHLAARGNDRRELFRFRKTPWSKQSSRPLIQTLPTISTPFSSVGKMSSTAAAHRPRTCRTSTPTPSRS